MPLNIEIKARTQRAAAIREILHSKGAEYKGLDHQTDTYFRVQEGRLKLREGNIENSLIFYHRPDQEGPKASEVHLYRPGSADPDLKSVLIAALPVWKTVEKHREIYFIENVKFHLDKVETLGEFVEIEAIDRTGEIGEAKLHEQCTYYMELFQIEDADLLSSSYSDMVS